MFCPNCGKELEEDITICKFCGLDLKAPKKTSPKKDNKFPTSFKDFKGWAFYCRNRYCNRDWVRSFGNGAFLVGYIWGFTSR